MMMGMMAEMVVGMVVGIMMGMMVEVMVGMTVGIIVGMMVGRILRWSGRVVTCPCFQGLKDNFDVNAHVYWGKDRMFIIL